MITLNTMDITRISQAVFALETVARLKGMEAELLPVAEALREIMQRAGNIKAESDLSDFEFLAAGMQDVVGQIDNARGME